LGLTNLHAAPAARQTTEPRPSYRLVTDKVAEFFNHLNATGQARTQQLVNDHFNVSMGLQTSADLKRRVAVLQLVRDRQTAAAIKRLEKTLDDKILTLAFCAREAKRSGLTDPRMKASQLYLDDRAKRPAQSAEAKTAKRIDTAIRFLNTGDPAAMKELGNEPGDRDIEDASDSESRLVAHL